ncbi:hypothetical protein [Streptomyces sp. DH12]|uniref:hypothetical protein n=1 Tax=Streptomyces sp. DH12 TaxID=2857010 RepID=UPI001E399B77|nr:hypothetical protein [Streptomyces sp. DH12]
MRPGDVLRFQGPAGAPFVVTVGPAFDERTITARIKSGEWTPLDAEAPSTGETDTTPKRPAQNAPKADWVTYAVSQHGMEREAAESMTKQQLVEATAPQAETTADTTTEQDGDDGHGD